MNERSTNSNKGQKAAQRSIKAKLTSIGTDLLWCLYILFRNDPTVKNIIEMCKHSNKGQKAAKRSVKAKSKILLATYVKQRKNG